MMPMVSLVLLVVCFDHACDDFDDGSNAGSVVCGCFGHTRDDLNVMMSMLEVMLPA